MINFSVFNFEFKHFIRNPFKVVAILLFLFAGIYALNNGANLYQDQKDEIAKIHQNIEDQKTEYFDYYDKNLKGPSDRPWINLTTPYWAIWYTPFYHIKEPSKLLVYSVGQTESFGYYKKVTFWSSPYDADMAQELANPERLQFGMFDFSFIILNLLPLFILIMIYNIKGAEVEHQFLNLIMIQIDSMKKWLASRYAFYFLFLNGIILILMIYGAILTEISMSGAEFWTFYLLIIGYTLIWFVLFFLMLNKTSNILTNTLKFVSIWILLVFIIPSSVQQMVSVNHPTNMATELIDAKRDDRDKLFNLPDSVFKEKLIALIPELEHNQLINQSVINTSKLNQSASALANELMKEKIKIFESQNHKKNSLISSSSILNPVTFFQNQFNKLSHSHYSDFQQFRNELQSKIDRQIKTMVIDNWNEKTIGRDEFLEYNQLFLSK